MFSNGDYYDLGSASSKVQQMKMLFDIKIQLDAIENILVKRNVIGAGDVKACVDYLKTTDGYKTMYDYLQVQEDGIKNYKDNPQQQWNNKVRRKIES